MEFWTLPRLGREYYKVEIITVPQLSSWEISFDHGVTWEDTEWDTPTLTCSRLVAGPGFVPNVGDGTEFSVVAASVVPYIRATDNPEVIVRSAPRIDLI